MSSKKSPDVREVENSLEDAEKKALKAFSSPSALAARTRLNQSFQRNDQRDDGVSVASSRRDSDRVKDSSNSNALEAISNSSAVKVPEKKSAKPSDGPSPEVVNSSINTLRNLADVAGLGLHDAPPQMPVDSVHQKVDNTGTLPANAASAAGSSDIDPDLVNAILKLVASKQAAASGTPRNDDFSDVATLTRQIEQLAEQRRSSRAAPTPDPTPARRSGPPRPTPEGTTLSPRSQARAKAGDLPAVGQGRSSQLDMMVNDNSFSVIADIVLQPFKKSATLSPQDSAQLEAALPLTVRQSFVEAVRYRLENNCPPGSSEQIHVVTRKCQELGFDKEGNANPLLAIGTTKTAAQDATTKQVSFIDT